MSTRYLDYDGLTTLVGLIGDEIDSAVSTAVAGVYTVKGSVAFADLPASPTVGDVYNVTDAFETTESFVEGAGVEYGAGTNVVYTDSGWDVLAGLVDLSGYPTSATAVGSGVNPVYVAGGAIAASTENVGGAAEPVYLKAGEITATGYDLSTFATSTEVDEAVAAIDLSGYVQTTDLVAITDTEISALFA